MKNYIFIAVLASLATPAFLNAGTPDVVREAQIREAIRQNETWTPENISKHPALFLQDTIAACDVLSEKIEAQQVAFLRLKKQADRKVSEAEGMIRRYSGWLEKAKVAFKKANETGTWPVEIDGFELDEDELEDRVADALERVELSKKSRKTNSAISKKVKIRQGVLKTKSRELISIRRKLVLQLESVKMNESLGEIDTLSDVLSVIKDMSLEIAEDPTKFSIEDMTEDDPDAGRKQSSREFLES